MRAPASAWAADYDPSADGETRFAVAERVRRELGPAAGLFDLRAGLLARDTNLEIGE